MTDNRQQTTDNRQQTGYPSIDKPWLKYYSEEDISTPLTESTLYGYIWEKNKDHLNDIALIFFGRKISYGELFKKIDSTTKMLMNLGVTTGDTVSVVAITTPEIIYLLYACARIGAIANMLDPRMPIDILERLIRNAKSKYLFMINIFGDITKELANRCDLLAVVEIDMKQSMGSMSKLGFAFKNGEKTARQKEILQWDAAIKKSSELSINMNSKMEPNGLSPVLIEYTGGTTGFPKGVLLSNNNVNSVGEQYGVLPYYKKRGELCQSVAAPFIAYTIIISTHMPLMTGKICKIAIYNPEKIAEDIIRNQYNHVYGNPAMWSKVIHSKEAKNKDFSKLIVPVTGADAISTILWEEINEFLETHNCRNVLCNGYGMTELASAVCVNVSKDVWRLGSVGIPFVKTTIAIFDTETEMELPYNSIGEVCVSGPSVMIGYLNNQQATDEMIRVHADGNRWLHTGDLGHIDNDGFVFIDGRMKRMIIRANGAKVFPGEIERIILLIKEIAGCAVVGKKEKDSSTGVFPVAFIVVKANEDQATVKERILGLCEKELQDYAVPKGIVFIDDIPLTPIGKVDYRKLEKMAEEANEEEWDF